MYLGEAVTQTRHALQAAWLAREAGEPDEVVIAALLHDVGHLLHPEEDGAAERGVDTRHENLGAEYLLARFGETVAQAARLHVEAKRCLCAIEPGYADSLSPASQRSLHLQGGPMTEEEAAEFLRRPFADVALRVRRYDDLAKDPEATVPGWEAYLAALERFEL